MKKTIALLLVIILMFNFIFVNTAYAVDIPDPLANMEAGQGQDGGSPDDDEREDTMTQDAPASDGAVAEVVEDGTVSRTNAGTAAQNTNSTSGGSGNTAATNTTVTRKSSSAGTGTKVTLGATSVIKSAVGAILGIIARIINVFFALQIDMLLAQLTYTKENGKVQYWLTIERMVFNRVALLDINYFRDTSTTHSYKVSNLDIESSSVNEAVKEGIAKTYYACRVIALSIGMVVLIYIGIRMAISTVASEQAKYKQMLVSWVESIILIFAMPYIMSLLFGFGEILTGAFYDMEQKILGASDGTGPGTYNIFEDTVRSKSIGMTISLSGLTLTMYSIIYWCMLFLTFKFLWTYMKRLLMVGFLIIISPIITITYAIDKVGDGKAQAFSMWLKEFTMNVLIQPLHALIYTIFVLTANQIAGKSPLIALALLFSLGQVEKMVKVVFDMKGLVTLQGMDAKFMQKG